MPNTTLELQTRVRRIDDVLDTEIDDQAVIMDIERGSYFGFNQTATTMWSLLAEPVAIGDLCDQLIQRFEVPREQCEQQVVAFLANLRDRGLVQIVTDESA